MARAPNDRNLLEVQQAGERIASVLISITGEHANENLPNFALAREVRSLFNNLDNIKILQADKDIRSIQKEIYDFLRNSSISVDTELFKILPEHTQAVQYENDVLRDYWELYSGSYREDEMSEAREAREALNNALQYEPESAAHHLTAEDTTIEIDQENKAEQASELISSLPTKVPAPVQITTADNIIVLKLEKHHSGPLSYVDANRFLSTLRETLASVIQDLDANSNIDRRFIGFCRVLLEYISVDLERASIIGIGFHHGIVSQTQDQIIDSANTNTVTALKSVLTNLIVILGQFEEWRTYNSELSKINTQNDQAGALIECLQDIANDFGEADSPTDKAIAGQLKDMIEPVITGLVNQDTVMAPLIFTFTDLFASFSYWSLNSIYPGEPSSTAKFIASLAVAQFSAKMLQKYCPILSNFPPLSFIGPVVEFIEKNGEKLLGTLRR